MNRKNGLGKVLAVLLISSCFSWLLSGCINVEITPDNTQKDSSSTVDTGDNKDQNKKSGNDSASQTRGTYSWPNGDRYEGELKNGLPEGQGSFSRKSAKTGEWTVIYEGQWRDGKMNGSGAMTNVDGDIFTGNWVNNMPSGQGTMKFRGDGGWQEYPGNWTPKTANSKGAYSEWDGAPPWDYYPTIPGGK